MDEFLVQLHFSFKSMLKHRILLIMVFFLTVILPITLSQFSGGTEFEIRWYSLLQIQMIFAIPLIPVIVNTIWSGKIKDFELKTIILYLTTPFNYFFSKLLAVWIGVSTSLILIDSIYWFLVSKQFLNFMWLATILQIVLTLSFVVTLTGLCSLIFKRTVYSIILIILYLLISIQYIRLPMFALWFNPDYVGEMLPQLHFTFQRSVLVLWIVLMLCLSSLLFKKQVVCK